MAGMSTTLMIAVALVAWDSHQAGEFAPRPQRFVWIAAVWSVLGLIAQVASPQIAGALAVGILLMMAYSYLTPDKAGVKTGTSGSRTGASGTPQPKAS